MSRKPRVLIEEWLPVDQIGAECMRERGASSALPPLYFLHIWWARRPLTISRAAVLGSLLPAWSPDWPADLRTRFPKRDSYHQWFQRLVGILGDPAKTRRELTEAKRRGIHLGADPYGYKRAFTMNPSDKDMQLVKRLLREAWGEQLPTVLDPMAGGGSIPFESLRFQLPTVANDLNPVASVVEKATLEYPARFGPEFSEVIELYGKRWAERVRERLLPFFPLPEGENVHAYIWARTVNCPATGKPIPLSPNWWLLKGNDPVCLRLIADPRADECRFEIVQGKKACAAADPDNGTVKRGDARSPWTGDFVDGDYIKAEAQAGRMGQQLMVIGLKIKGGFEFRAASQSDRDAVSRAETELQSKWSQWEASGVIPTEGGPPEHLTGGTCYPYGMRTWPDLFSPRQLLSLCTALEELRKVQQEIARELPANQAEAVTVYLSLAFDKSCDYNSRMVRWDGTRNKIANTFDRHDFSFKWSHAEFDASRNLYSWVVGQVVDAYSGIAELANPAGSPPVQIQTGSANHLQVGANSASLICTDPPYYDNVIYSELSDFFYVWMKRSLGQALPQFFHDPLVNKDDEAVANPARFHGQKGVKDLADADYERKMASCFRESARVLRDDGILTVMFTNKRVRAWDALAMGLIEAGFVIETSWPIHTESDSSLHIAKKNAAKSTILLVCRKRDAAREETWWDTTFQGRVRQVVAKKAQEFEEMGMSGVDLYLSTFGPVLEVISSAWPVKDPQGGEPIRPERALDLARQAVSEYRIKKMSRNYTVELDPVTRWYVLSWDLFQAAEFPFDEGRKLALAVSGEVPVGTPKGRGKGRQRDFLDEVLKGSAFVVSKKGDYLHLEDPIARHIKGKIETDAEQYPCLLDAFHSAIVLMKEDGLGAVNRMLERTGLARDRNFLGAFELLQRVIPPVRDEFKALEEIRSALLRDKVAAPERVVEEVDPSLFGEVEGDEEEEEVEV
ncbi:MAG: hypothetical protein AMXMBFR33_17600 [Candidatus Xenobia bacterium]